MLSLYCYSHVWYCQCLLLWLWLVAIGPYDTTRPPGLSIVFTGRQNLLDWLHDKKNAKFKKSWNSAYSLQLQGWEKPLTDFLHTCWFIIML